MFACQRNLLFCKVSTLNSSFVFEILQESLWNVNQECTRSNTLFAAPGMSSVISEAFSYTNYFFRNQYDDYDEYGDSDDYDDYDDYDEYNENDDDYDDYDDPYNYDPYYY